MTRREFGVAIGLPEPIHSELQGWREKLGDPNAAAIPPHITLLPPTALHDEATKYRKPGSVFLTDQETAQTQVWVTWPRRGRAGCR